MFQRVFLFLLLVILSILAPAALAHEGETRTHIVPDLAYSFIYPLDAYSVRQGCACATLNGGQDVIFPGVIVIEPNDSLIYSAGADVSYRISIAAVAAPENAALDSGLLGSGPLMQYEPSLISADDVVTIDLGGVPALRIDNVATGPAGVLHEIVALHEGLLYQFIIEPAQPTMAGDTEAGSTLADGILATFLFGSNGQPAERTS